MKMSDQEAKLVKDIKTGKTVSLEESLLILSRLRSRAEIEVYRKKLDLIHHGFVEYLQSKIAIDLSACRKYLTSTRARLLFEYLWHSKPRRCDTSFLLTDVADAQMSSDMNQRVGSCIGLTSLYSVLGLREELDLTILVSDSHVLNRLRANNDIYNIDSTDPLGFGCDVDEANFTEYPIIMLVASVLNSRGMIHWQNGNLENAERDYSWAIEINSAYANPYNNRGNVKLEKGDHAGAARDYSEAINVNVRFVEAYYNRGIAKENSGDYVGAVEDFNQTIQLDSQCTDAYWRRGAAKERLGDYSGAVEDFNRVMELDPDFREKMIRFRNRAEALQQKQQLGVGYERCDVRSC